jgi:NAD(P)-dependent dehydrogenase (short-subunit alcohol dehydrogenase family)
MSNTTMSKDEAKLSGGVAVITGAGSGIGAALARHVARLQMTVVVADISRTNAEKVRCVTLVWMLPKADNCERLSKTSVMDMAPPKLSS